DELSSYLYIDKAAITRIIKSLVAKGFVIKKQDLQDRRCNRIFLTEKAKQKQEDIHKRVVQWNAFITESLDGEAYLNTYNALQKMVNQVLQIDKAQT
ncbi:MAG: MarR family transcriptional regulator, partial [Sphaerochaetaceae bacterium]|nr:MarR family transcriptional regulator [Sphaerochaetaceae bacterium]